MEGSGAKQRGDTPVFLGVDTHSEAHVAVALDGAGRRAGELRVPNSEAGYAELLGWVLALGHPVTAGIEGTGSYGSGLSRFLRRRGLRVVEVNRTSRQHRRRYGKHDAGGNRDANRALHVVVLNRMRRDPRTQGYVARRTAEGKSKKEAMRCLKRYIARETYRAILLDAAVRTRVPPG